MLSARVACMRDETGKDGFVASPALNNFVGISAKVKCPIPRRLEVGVGGI